MEENSELKGEMINKEALEEVAGGKGGAKKLFEKTVSRKCRYCGENFEYPEILLNFGGIGPAVDRYNWEINTCNKCKKNHSFKSYYENPEKYQI